MKSAINYIELIADWTADDLSCYAPGVCAPREKSVIDVPQRQRMHSED